MTSLNETLPILDEAVPALPTKLEDVAKESDAFHQAAGEAVATLKNRREQAETLVANVRQALEWLREQAQEDEKRVGDSARALEDMAEEKLREVDEAEGRITTEGEEARTALGALESQLEAGTQRARTAHEEARAALEALGEEARNRQPELEAAGDAVEQALKAAQQAVAEGQTLVEQGVSTVKDAMDRLLGEAQARLARTHQYLDDLRDEQEKAVKQALSEMEGECGRLSQEVAQSLRTGVQEALENELDTVVNTLAEVGQQVVQLEAETQSRREDLAAQIAEVESRIGPLQQGTQQVKGAADRLGIDWP
jgi:chromosome segregation ATPase